MEVEPSCCEQSCKTDHPLYETAVCAYCVILAVGGRLKDIKGTWPVNPCLDPHHADTMLEHLTPASSGILNDLPTHGKAPEYLKKSEHSGFVWMARLAAAPPRMQH